MSTFTMPVSWYMSAPVHTIARSSTLNALHHRFIKHRISSLAVVDGDRLVGVVSRTDLIRQSFSRREADPTAPLLVIPDQTVADIMSPSSITVRSQDTVAEAADRMVAEKIHRVYVVDAGHLVGVLSARDVMPALVDLRLTEPIGRYMTTPLFVVPTDEEIVNATSFLETTHVSGVVVLGEAGPMGVFTQHEALECRHLPRGTSLENAMNTELLTVTEETPVHRAVEEVVKLGIRRVITTDATGVRGMVTPLDLLRAAR